MSYTWNVVVEYEGDACIARLTGGTAEEDRETPFRGRGETPLEATADLIRLLYEWRKGGCDHWWRTSPQAVKTATHFGIAHPGVRRSS